MRGSAFVMAAVLGTVGVAGRAAAVDLLVAQWDRGRNLDRGCRLEPLGANQLSPVPFALIKKQKSETGQSPCRNPDVLARVARATVDRKAVADAHKFFGSIFSFSLSTPCDCGVASSQSSPGATMSR